jgi:hypothetical protein
MKYLSIFITTITAITLLSAVAIAFPTRALAAEAGTIELSLGGSYTHSTYTNTDYEWSRRYGASAGYYLTSMTELEFSYQVSVDRTKITNFEDTTFHDQVYGLTVSQSFFDKTSWFQPYVKVGIGELNRDASGVYVGGTSPPQTEDNVTGILGAGLKLYVTKAFGFRGEFTSYIVSGQSWTNNLSATFGFSVFF